MFAEIRLLLSAYFKKVGEYQAGSLLTVVYWTVVGPTWIVMRIAGRRLLAPRTSGRSTWWVARNPAPRDLASLSRQY
jgi:hypothetical protein